MTVDLSQFDTKKTSEEGVWVEIESPIDGEPLGIHFKILGSDSEVYNKQIRKNKDKMMKQGMRNIKSENLEVEEIELLVACTVDWDNIVDNGEKLECTKENVRCVYKNYPWIKDQVDDFIGDRSNFLSQ